MISDRQRPLNPDRANCDAFLRHIDETCEISRLRMLAIILLPNHWHFVVRPTADDQVSEFFRRLSVMHTMRYVERNPVRVNVTAQ